MRKKTTYTETRFSKFKPYEDAEHENDIDRRFSVRTFTGRMTRLRWEILYRFVRARSVRFERCGHEWDCCGCMCGQYMSLSYKHNQVKIILTQTFNY